MPASSGLFLSLISEIDKKKPRQEAGLRFPRGITCQQVPGLQRAQQQVFRQQAQLQGLQRERLQAFQQQEQQREQQQEQQRQELLLFCRKQPGQQQRSG